MKTLIQEISPAVKATQFPCVMKDERDGQILLAIGGGSSISTYQVVALTGSNLTFWDVVGKSFEARKSALQPLNGSITLSNDDN